MVNKIVLLLIKTMTDFADCELPPQNLEDFRHERETLRLKYGKYFKNNEQFDFFCMLPLSTEEQRTKFMNRWLELERANKSADQKKDPKTKPDE